MELGNKTGKKQKRQFLKRNFRIFKTENARVWLMCWMSWHHFFLYYFIQQKQVMIDINVPKMNGTHLLLALNYRSTHIFNMDCSHISIYLVDGEFARCKILCPLPHHNVPASCLGHARGATVWMNTLRVSQDSDLEIYIHLSDFIFFLPFSLYDWPIHHK